MIPITQWAADLNWIVRNAHKSGMLVMEEANNLQKSLKQAVRTAQMDADTAHRTDGRVTGVRVLPDW